MNRLKNRWIWLVAALALLAIGLGYRSWQDNNAAPAYRTTRIEKGPIVASVSASGTLSPVVSVQVGSQVSGQLRDIHVDFNSEVKKGQLIARIDPENFEHKVRQAEADLDAARAQALTQQSNIAAQRAQAAQVEVNVANARRDLERKEQLMAKGFISGAERDTVLATYNALTEQVKAAHAQVKVAESNAAAAAAVVRQRAAQLAQSRVELERTAIRAPVNGVIIKRSVERGQTVAASLQAPELFIIAENLADMRVDTAVDEAEIGRIRNGQRATFTVDAFPGRTFEGKVLQIRKAAQKESNVVTYMVEVSAPNPGHVLLPGMTANVRVLTDSREQVLKVANAALRYRPPGATDKPAARPSPAAAAADAPAGGGGQGMRERLERELALDPAQKEKLAAIFSGMREKMQAARQDPDRQQAMERVRAGMRAEVAAMLSPEQGKKYEEIQAAQRPGGSGGRGSIHVLDNDGRPREVAVRLGLTDGLMTEIAAAGLAEGQQAIVGSAPKGDGAQPARRGSSPRMF